MFEKESKEYAIGLTYPKFQDDQIANIVLRDVEGSFQKGAEFGYNKGFKDCAKARLNVTTISDCPIKDDWHKVSDKLPEMDTLVYLWKKTNDYPVVACRHIPYGQKEWVWDCKWGSGFTLSQLEGEVCLWKEIVLPELKENE